MSDLTVSFVQAALQWHEPDANRAELARFVSEISIPTDLVVLPEMFPTGFSMQAAEHAEPADGPTLAWMRDLAAKRDAVITGSAMVHEDGHFYNRLLWVRPNGSYSHYDKRHLFRMAGEHEVYTPGQRRLIEEWRGWRICPLICYDLRFPVWSRNDMHAPYDLLLYVANWPAVRRTAWMTLLRARAMENLAYTMGVNCVGIDASSQMYEGDSALLDMKGEYLVEVGNQETSITRTLRRADLVAYRSRFPALQDADAFELGEGVGELLS
ncbi:amidohydrolase [Hymenobacter busanensis]|uniref:Omega-amidase YafV n=1 Tax=Hymenobacter busanensis TaxID=2607656 RepID=A0A7L5A282_9BACT|nr:amidohydrolase [Hymenobacter busanensis]KAA9333447.1 amidohydrolase [Hymenobacter busanensis]QHJ07870.1 amidohydrolase [Hymenobacter busanensis]